MKNCEKSYEKGEPLQLIGSQMSFSLRSNHNSVAGSPRNTKCRPRSAALPYRNQISREAKGIRPKSAEHSNFSDCMSHFQWPCNIGEHQIDEKPSVSMSHYTDSSSKLLQNLLGNSQPTTKDVNSDAPASIRQESTHLSCVVQREVGEYPVTEKNCGYLIREYREVIDTSGQVDWSKFSKAINDNSTPYENEMRKETLQNLKIESWAPEEKTVRFMERQYSDRAERESEKEIEKDDRHLHSVEKADLYVCEFEEANLSPAQDVQMCQTFRSNSRANLLDVTCQRNALEVLDEEDQILGDSVRGGGSGTPRRSWFEVVNPPENSESDGNDAHFGNTETTSTTTASSLSESPVQQEKHEKVVDYCSERRVEVIDEIPEKCDEMAEGKVKYDCPCVRSNTYEEIVRLLQTLDEEESESLNLESKKDARAPTPPQLEEGDGKLDNLQDVYSYLEKVEKDSELLDQPKAENADLGLTGCEKTFSSPRLAELLDKNSVELAHEVLSLQIQIEDQKQGLKLLRQTLAEMKETTKTADIEHQEALQKANAEAEALVQRHQKFIKQLLNEKKKLNEAVSKLVQDLKTGEEKHKRNMKAIEEKHQIEMKRVKEAQAVADKLKREKWMEIKTQKIKEMTVKGLEPELSRMAAQQQQEMQELRNLHRAELEAVELRATRRTAELMDQLRVELTKEKEGAIDRELEALRGRMEKEFEIERHKLEKYCERVKEELRKEEEKTRSKERECQQRLQEHAKEAEKERQRIVQDHQEKLEEVERRHLIELKNLRESLEAEKEIWKNNYKKEEACKFFERESELRQQFKRERDKDIEMIIETLEKESAQAELEFHEAAENKLKRVKEKLENEIREAEASEAILKGKLTEVKSQVLEKEDVIVQLNSQIRQLQTEIAFLRKSCEEMTSERTNLREVIRKEFERSISEMTKEKESLEKEILALKDSHFKELTKKDQLNIQSKNEMQKELTKVYSRIRTAVSKKEKVIEALREENKATVQRCQQLEVMLDRQRRNLLLQ